VNYYKTLGIDRTATHEQIVSAFRKMVLTYHPDRNHSPGAQEMFIQAHKAFEALGNPGVRESYDSRFYEPPPPRQEPRDYPHRRANGYYDKEYTQPSETEDHGWAGKWKWKAWAPFVIFVAIILVLHYV
jgi:DnaJ-class molecular chaperone